MNFQIPDIEKLKKQEFVFTSDFHKTGYTMMYCKGMRFAITKLKKGYLHFKVLSSYEECMPSLLHFARTLADCYVREIKECERALRLWEKDPDGFEEIPKGEHNHHSDDTPLCMDGVGGTEKYVHSKCYRHKSGKLNAHSYLRNHNAWFNKKFYEVELAATTWKEHKHRVPSKATLREIYSAHFRASPFSGYEVKVFNQAKFKAFRPKTVKA